MNIPGDYVSHPHTRATELIHQELKHLPRALCGVGGLRVRGRKFPASAEGWRGVGGEGEGERGGCEGLGREEKREKNKGEEGMWGKGGGKKETRKE